MGWKDCLQGQQLNGSNVPVDDGDLTVEISVNRMQFGSARVAVRHADGSTVTFGPKDTATLPNPLTFVCAGAGHKGGQCGWIIQLGLANNADPFPDIDVTITQASGDKLTHSYVCPNDQIPASGIELRDYVKLV